MIIVRLLAISAFFLCTPLFMKSSFKIPPSHAQISFCSEWETDAADSNVHEILKQPFRYLARGNQCTVFESENQQYVLKLFRYTRPRFPFVHCIKKGTAILCHKKVKQDLFTKLNKTFQAAKVACTEGAPFTQVIYCHLNLTQSTLPIVRVKAGRDYFILLDRVRFCLQRKVAPFKQTLLDSKNNPEEMHLLIDSLVQLLINRSALGIRNSDSNLAPNFGFLNGQAVEIDFGNYCKASRDPNQREEEINRFLHRFEDWLVKFAPEYVTYLRKLKHWSLD